MEVDVTLYPFCDLTAQMQVRSGQITGPASYVTGGDEVDVGNDLKLSEVFLFLCEPPSNGSVIRLARSDYTATTLKWFDMAGAEIANGVDLSGYTARFLCTGK